MITITATDHGLRRNDLIEIAGERFVVTHATRTTLTTKPYSKWHLLKHMLFWNPLRAWRWSDWMSESYYLQQEWNEWEREALEAINDK